MCETNHMIPVIQKDGELRGASYLLCVLQIVHCYNKTGSYPDLFEITTGRRRKGGARHI